MKIKMTYAEKLKDPRWQQRRLRIMERDGWACQSCADTKSTLNVHHLEYNSDPWDVSDEDLITLCETCHKECEQCLKLVQKALPGLQHTFFQIIDLIQSGHSQVLSRFIDALAYDDESRTFLKAFDSLCSIIESYWSKGFDACKKRNNQQKEPAKPESPMEPNHQLTTNHETSSMDSVVR